MASESTAAEVLLQSTSDHSLVVTTLVAKLENGNASATTHTSALVTAQLLIAVHDILTSAGQDTTRDPICSTELVADALTAFVQHMLTDSVINDNETMALEAAKLCSSASPSLQRILVRRLLQNILADLDSTIDYCCSKDISNENFTLSRSWLGKDRQASAFDLEREPPQFIPALFFLRCLALQPNTASLIPMALFRPLFILLAAGDYKISALTRDTVLALLAIPDISSIAQEQPDDVAENHPLTPYDIWLQIFDLVEGVAEEHYRAHGYSVWLAILTCCPDWTLRSKVMHESRYWPPIQSGLALGAQGQCKLCLAILKASIRLADTDIDCRSMHFQLAKSSQLIERYDKYETLYVTIVLNRYVNQVRDCIDDLLSLLEPSSGIDTAWLIAILSVSVDKGTQDSVRKLFGNLIMEYSAPILSRQNADPHFFLVERFLPWAVNGSLLVSSVISNGNSTTCVHGEKLSCFVKNLLLLSPTTESCQVILHAILGYIDEHNDHAFPYAKAFILQGITEGLRERRTVPDDSCSTLLARIASQGGYLKVVGLWVLATVAQFGDSAVTQNIPKPMNRVHQDARKLIDARLALSSDPSIAADILHRKSFSGSARQIQYNPEPSVSQFLVWLDASSRKCLTQDGLVASCVYMNAAFDRPSTAGDILLALNAIWEELEIQEFDRDALMAFPQMLLHKTCIQFCQESDALLSCIVEKIMALLELSQYRMHLFSALAEALRWTALYDTNAGLLPWDVIIVKFATDPPVTKIEFQLEAVFASKLQQLVPSLTYESFYGKTEGRAYAAFFDLVNAMPITAISREECMHALDTLLQPWLKQKQPVPVTSKWKSSTQLQVMLILSKRCLSSCPPDDADRYLQHYLDIIAIEPLPRYRFLLEWMTARLFFRLRRRTEIIELTRDMDISNPKLCVSLIKMALALACVQDSEEEFGAELMTQLMVLATCPKVAIRHEGQWSIPSLWDHALEKNWSTILENVAAERLNNWLRTLEPYKNPPAHRLLERFDPRRDHSLRNLLEGEYLSMEPPEQCRVRRSDFIALYQDDPNATPYIRNGGQSGHLPLGSPRISPQPTQNLPNVPKLTQSLDSLQVSQVVPAPLQTKGDSWRAEIDALFAGASAALNPSIMPSSRRSRNLVVVASLIDKAHNIGGLSRVSEIFGCASLAVHDRRVLKSKDFASVAVSSELWLPIEEVPASPDSLIAYLTGKKLDGYTIVGIEQTDDSRVLGAEDTKLPEKLVLVLGSEREGIPARVLGVCDWCVEIRQSGVTRSMNVQTAAGVVLYEYDRQWGGTKTRA